MIINSFKAKGTQMIVIRERRSVIYVVVFL